VLPLLLPGNLSRCLRRTRRRWSDTLSSIGAQRASSGILIISLMGGLIDAGRGTSSRGAGIASRSRVSLRIVLRLSGLIIERLRILAARHETSTAALESVSLESTVIALKSAITLEPSTTVIALEPISLESALISLESSAMTTASATKLVKATTSVSKTATAKVASDRYRTKALILTGQVFGLLFGRLHLTTGLGRTPGAGSQRTGRGIGTETV